MSGLVIGFTTRNITLWEREHGNLDFKSLLENPCESNIIELVKIGNNRCSDDEAFDKLDEYLFANESNSIFSAILAISEHLANDRRLPKYKVEELRRQFEEEGLLQ